jgi:UDP-N-acetylmuramoyl-tripeptide--D-alanyl-D-alanine ligase
MMAALENFFLIPAENKIVILGDMAELGESSTAEHGEIIKALENEKMKLKIFVGEEFEKALFESSSGFMHFKNVSQLKTWFNGQSFKNYFFLLKASRVMGLEGLVQ